MGGVARLIRPPFHYEVAWDSHKEFPSTLGQKWGEGGRSGTMEDLKNKLTSLPGELSQWGKSSFGNVQLQIRNLQRELEVDERLGPIT
jgi:hypothetical protein